MVGLWVAGLLAVSAAEPSKTLAATAPPNASVPLLYAAEGAKCIQYYNKEGQRTWEYPAEMVRDVVLLPNGNILFSYNDNYNSGRQDNASGVREITPKGETVFRFQTTGQVFSCARLDNGLTVVGAAGQGRILFVNAKGEVVKSFPVKNKPGHSCMRHVRATPSGTILVAEESARAVREYTSEGVLVREMAVPFVPFSVKRLANGNTLVSGKTAIVELDAKDQVVWQLKDTDVPELGVRWFAGFQVLGNGDLLVCNAGGKTPLFRVTREAQPRIVWKSDATMKDLPLGHGVAAAPKWVPQGAGTVQRPAESAEAKFPVDLPGAPREIVFTTRSASGDGHWYANFGYWGSDENRKLSGKRGRLCKLDLKDGKCTTLIEDLDGAIRDAAVSYDGRRILFSWRKGGGDFFHLFECASDGKDVRQITFGPWDDIEPCYLPDGGILFVSTRSKRWVNCMNSQVATIFRSDGNGKNIVSVSGNIEQDNSPAVLPDGRIIYTRWEYIDRSQMVYHHLWIMNPDGTGQMVYFGNMHPGTLMIDAKPIPGTRSIVAAISDGHGAQDHMGRVSVLSNEKGPDDKTAVKTISKRNAPKGKDKFTDKDCVQPYPFSSELFLVGKKNELMLMDGKGEMTKLFAFPDPGIRLHDPLPIMSRPCEPVIPSRVDLSKTTGQLICQNVYTGRRMDGIAPGEIKKLLVLETLPKPVNFDGMPPPISFMGTFSLERILGTVPVEADGSANFEVPANRSIQLVALDAQNRSVKRMQSFLAVMPGEVNSCVGCHEERGKAPVSRPGKLAAVLRPPSKIQPLAGIPEICDFPRDIQPIMDEHCVKCHNGRERAGGVELTGDRNPMFSMAYYNLMSRMQVFVGGNLAKSNFPPKTLGDSISPLMAKLQGQDVVLADTFTEDWTKWPRLVKKESTAHSGVHLRPDQIEKIRFWINSGAVYPGTYASLGASGSIGWLTQNSVVNNIADLPSVGVASKAVVQRCASCHTGVRSVPVSAVDNLKTLTYGIGCSGYEEPDFKRLSVSKYSRFRVFNLTHPDLSLMLMAPLAKAAGGLGTCVGKDGPPVFANTGDPDYQAILAGIRDTGKRLDEITRFDMPNYRPNPQWLREMKRFGLLPKDQGTDKQVNPYEVEKRYFESLWCRPGAKEQWGPESAESEANMKCTK